MLPLLSAALLAAADPDSTLLAAALRSALGAPRLADVRWGDIADVRTGLVATYEGRGWRPLWVAQGRGSVAARAVVREFQAARVRGLDPDDYDADRLATLLDSLDGTPARTARFDVALSAAATRYALALDRGRVDPRSLHPTLRLAREPFDVARTLGDLKGPFAKAGQFAALRYDVLPPELREAFVSLQDRVPPRPFDEIAATIESELGAPLASVFAELEPTPLGAASVAQVHRGKLARSGEPVAVKVQYGWLVRSLRADLAVSRWLLRLFVPRRGANGLDRDRLFADDEADIGDRAGVIARHLRGLAIVHEYAVRDGIDGQWLLLRERGRGRGDRCERCQDQCGMSHISAFVSSRCAAATQCFIVRRSTGGIFLLRGLIDKHSILLICGFNGTSFVEVVDIFCGLATIASRKCSSFQ